MAVPVDLTPTFAPGKVVRVLDGAGYRGSGSAGSARTYDVSNDGRRFLMIKEGGTAVPSLVVVQNWFSELMRLVPVN